MGVSRDLRRDASVTGARAVSGAGLQILRVVTVVPGPIHWYPLG